ncbi:TPA: hypothetical protein ACKPYC_001520 [Pseudomonas aeruginosa]|uniref:Uncharacterized protein n=1 Tax=Pseudomonas aeruginosa TaxID=287 RepID=A0A7M3B4F4_PSEAI|nr:MULTISPECIES: hypothetical protein [Pseudomonas]AVN41981.1 hypothetical protein AM474_00245 [Pseudomonas aeruginosa]AVZ19088.1 hypothetical protein DBA97_12500 [Pseudomonas aeruginosa]AXL83119.1 hypothetical protein Y89_2602 [Pseudomonas aeruginosa]AXO28558.1 hypothetical protein Ysp71_2607 [Pseudomonas aeruginosa]AYW40666.1 hypothetical protein DL351_14620 [Pseudomonas aeruginosa]
MAHDNNKKSRLLDCLLILMILACSRGEALAALSRQELQETRTLATMTTVNALLYYNLNGIPYEAENLEAFTYNLNRLHELSARAGDTVLAEQVRLLGDAVAQLEQLPQSTADARSVWPAYTRWLPGVIEAHFRLEKSLSDRYDATPGVAQQSGLHGLSHDIGRMLLSYQMASFPNFGGDLWILDDRVLIALNADIERRFAELAERNGTEALKAPLRNYRFVRHHLLDPAGNWAPNAVALYLAKAMRALDSEALAMGDSAQE